MIKEIIPSPMPQIPILRKRPATSQMMKRKPVWQHSPALHRRKKLGARLQFGISLSIKSPWSSIILRGRSSRKEKMSSEGAEEYNGSLGDTTGQSQPSTESIGCTARHQVVPPGTVPHVQMTMLWHRRMRNAVHLGRKGDKQDKTTVMPSSFRRAQGGDDNILMMQPHGKMLRTAFPERQGKRKQQKGEFQIFLLFREKHKSFSQKLNC